MSRFKVGDRVRRIRCDNGDDMQVGRVGTIKRVDADGDVIVDVDGGSDACFCMAEYLELVPVAEATGTAAGSAQDDKPKFKVGDRVRYSDFKCTGVGVVTGQNEDDSWFVRVEARHRDHCPFDDNTTRIFEESNLEPATLTIQAGKYYLTRDGRKVGPATRHDFGDGYPWEVETAYWVSDNGEAQSGSTGPDLVAEWTEEPPAAEQQAGGTGYGSTAGFTVPMFDEDDFDICGYRDPSSKDSDDDIVQLSVGELTAALADSLKVARKVGKTIKRGDLVVLARPALVTGIDRYHASVQTDGGNYSLPLAALTAA